MGVFVILTIRVGVFVMGINASVVAVMTPRRVPVAVGEGVAVALAVSVSVPVGVPVSVGRLAAVGIGCLPSLRAFSALVICPPTKKTTPTKAKIISHNLSPGEGG
jgi:hypothetical protein